jgi:transcriptional regulator with PAS, ATPase and Fis domain
MVDDGRFRGDLYYRLNVIAVTLPPLRERRDDIPLLVEHFLDRARERTGLQKRLAPRALEALLACPWRGNVRELQNELLRAVALAGDVIELRDLSPQTLEQADEAAAGGQQLTLKERMDRVERRILEEMLERHDHNKTRCAKALGLSRFGFLKKLDKHGLR